MRVFGFIILIYILSASSVKSCSPYAVPPLTSQQVAGTDLVLNWQSATAWDCDYNIYVEIRCQSNPGGAPILTSLSGCINKPSAATIPYPSAHIIDVSSLCSGETYIFRGKETPCGSSGGGSAWTADFTFIAGGVTAFSIATSPSTIICIGTCATVVAVAQNSCNPSVSYSWDNGGGTDSVATFCPTATTDYIVTASTVTTCGTLSTTDTVTITVEIPPVGGVTLASPDHLCEGDSSILSLAGYSGVIQWQSAASSTGPWTNLGVGDTSAYATPALFSDTYYQAELSNFCGSDISSVSIVYAEPFPVLDFNVTNICEYETAQFNNATSIATGIVSSWNWDFGDGSTATSEDPSHPYAVPGTYDIQLVATSDYGCIDSITKSIDVFPEPIAAYSTTDVCKYTTAQFADNSSVGGGGSIDNWYWTFGDGNASTMQNPSNPYNAFGVYYIELIATTDQGCTDTASFPPIEIFAVPASDFTADTVCLNTPPTQFFNNSTIADGTQIGNIWSFADGDSAFVENPTHSYLLDGFYNVVLITTSTNLCYDTTIKQVKVYSIPVVDFSADTLEGCAPLPIEFINNSSNAVSYEWDLDDGPLTDEENPMNTYGDPGMITDYTISLTATTTNGCVENLTLVDYITIWPLPVADFWAGPNPATILYPYMDFENLSAGDLTPPTNYYWDFGDGTTYYGEDTLHAYNNQDTGTYIVQLITENFYTCRDIAYDTIVIINDYIIFAPTAFSPNGDGINETFFPKGIGFNDPSFKFEFSIINRWGDVLFHTKDHKEGWDGTANGKDGIVQQGVYIWIIKTQDVTLTSRKHQYVGHVTVVK